MVLRATASKFASFNSTPPPERRDGRSRTTRRVMEVGRRGLLLSTVIATSQVNDSRTQLLQKYLKKSEDNKAKNDKERLDSYYKRNYQDYFEFVEGSLQGKKELSESEKGILDWLRSNK
ncbi:uncharacterized protein LOC130786504 [Actinidia eriantha]|uniref:uncharacterized protein LOC130774873 n=1 Tax=Actinidia eriantha TaxID=165200 RepID=UPI002590A341|nr:uncharacterized protein LOC130774873 [Actinidia eriantha]XP_057502771.1 uncharacterized protein LOC130786504 [Actinidia eriantha]